MSNTNRWGRTVGLIAAGALAALLAGCATYVEGPPPPPPPPPVAYVPPPPPPPAPPAPPGPVMVVQSDADFYEPLSPYGHWEIVGDYGRCWVPAGVGPNWQPYNNGYWEYTDAGWYWVSDEPWAWATYHYGRWVLDPYNGWVWVPQTQWAPAWVVWREGGGYCGWAPMSVTARFGGGGFVDVSIGVYAPRAFVFVDERHFCDPVRPGATVVVNQTIINNTVNITNVRIVNRTVVNGGPRPEVIARVTGRSVQPVSVRQLRHQQEATFVRKQPALQKLRPAHKPKAAQPGQAEARSETERHEAAQQDNAGREQTEPARQQQEDVDRQQTEEAQREQKAAEREQRAEEKREKKEAAKKKKAQQDAERHAREDQGEEER